MFELIGNRLRNYLNSPYDPEAILDITRGDASRASPQQVDLFNALLADTDSRKVACYFEYTIGTFHFSVAGTHPMRSVPQSGWYGSIAGKPAAVTEMLAATPPKAPRITPDHIDAQIKSEAYYVFPGTTLTVCALTLANGFIVTGESAAASPENFDPVIGSTIARKNAREKIWALEGYVLRNQLSQNG
jgi:hypothetical protein